MTGVLSVPMHVPEAAAPRDIERGTPCTMIILGASGDLAHRKLMPALFHLMSDGLLAEDFRVIGVGRSRDERRSISGRHTDGAGNVVA